MWYIHDDVGPCSSYCYVHVVISADYAIFSALVFGDHFWNCPGIRGEEGVNTHPQKRANTKTRKKKYENGHL